MTLISTIIMFELEEKVPGAGVIQPHSFLRGVHVRGFLKYDCVGEDLSRDQVAHKRQVKCPELKCYWYLLTSLKFSEVPLSHRQQVL